MTIDLEAIERWRTEGTLDPWPTLTEADEHISSLVAEVKQLRRWAKLLCHGMENAVNDLSIPEPKPASAKMRLVVILEEAQAALEEVDE